MPIPLLDPLSAIGEGSVGCVGRVACCGRMGDDEGSVAGDVAAGVRVASAGCCEEVQRRGKGGYVGRDAGRLDRDEKKMGEERMPTTIRRTVLVGPLCVYLLLLVWSVCLGLCHI